MKKIFLFISFLLTCINAQQIKKELPENIKIILPTDTKEDIIRKAANVIPATRQFEWQKLEFIGFIHFGINTFMDVEWGIRDADISKFNPEKLDCNQWVKVLKDAGIKMVILTAKHHDGFCLWPSKYTDYNISKTPYKNGKGDIVKELSDACRRFGLKFGIYLSPWDMHEKTYGTPDYNQFFMNQLRELLTNYGKISEVWFDGACGEPNCKKEIYDWNSYYKLIRELQPDAVIAIMGPDVRWVGTESGYGRKTEWSVLPGSFQNLDNIAANSQQKAIDGAFIPKDLTDEDLGSRDKIFNASTLIWYPAEIDVSIRPRWFYHKEDDEFVKSPYKLFDIYFNSVGLNGVLLLNIPPDKNGLIHENDIKSLKGLRYLLDKTFDVNLAKNARIKASNELKNHNAKNILDNNYNTYWTTEDTIQSAWIELTFPKKIKFNCAMLQENILIGQRIEKFHIESWSSSSWQKIAEGTTVGYKRLLRFPEVTTNKIRIVIEQSRTNPTLSSFGLYLTPPELSIKSTNKIFKDHTVITISSDQKDTKIFYKLNNEKRFKKYINQIVVNKKTKVTAYAISKNGKKSLPFEETFYKAKYNIINNSKYDDKYSANGLYALVDGAYGTTNFNDGKWQGYHGNDIDIIIDLEEVKNLKSVSVNFLRNIPAYIFLPQEVIISVSNDGKNYETVYSFKEELKNENETIIKSYKAEFENIKCKYIKLYAKNIGTCPEWHTGKGDKAWLFIDEITIE
ncbi:alpha-L-fucosidase [Rosettibacter firmus]|uniref:alpha-L-fucosidase n=1 Tax=Rosettibacter firmus TaxID=3111522 RepID=UPI00336C0200